MFRLSLSASVIALSVAAAQAQQALPTITVGAHRPARPAAHVAAPAKPQQPRASSPVVAAATRPAATPAPVADGPKPPPRSDQITYGYGSLLPSDALYSQRLAGAAPGSVCGIGVMDRRFRAVTNGAAHPFSHAWEKVASRREVG